MVSKKYIATTLIFLLKLSELVRPVNGFFNSELEMVPISQLNETDINLYKELPPCKFDEASKTSFADCSLIIDQKTKHIINQKKTHTPPQYSFVNCYLNFAHCTSLTDVTIDKSLIEYVNEPGCRSFVVEPSKEALKIERIHYQLAYHSLSKHGDKILGKRIMKIAEQHFNTNPTPDLQQKYECGISDSIIINENSLSLYPGDASCSNSDIVIAGDISPNLKRELDIFYTRPNKESIIKNEELYQIDLSELQLFAKSTLPVLSYATFKISGFDKNVTEYIEKILYERLLLEKKTSGNRVITICPGDDDVARYNFDSDTVYISLEDIENLELLGTIIPHELLHAAGMDHPPMTLLRPTLSPLISMGLGRVIVSFHINNQVAIIPHLTLPSTIERLYLLISSGVDIAEAITMLKEKDREINNTCNEHLYLDGSLLEGDVKINSNIQANFTMVKGHLVQHPPIPHGYLDIHTYPFKKEDTVVVIGQEGQNVVSTFSLIISNLKPGTKISIDDNVLNFNKTIEIRSSQGNNYRCIKTLLNNNTNVIPQLPDKNNNNITNQSGTENEVASSGGEESTDHEATTAQVGTTPIQTNPPDITPAPQDITPAPQDITPAPQDITPAPQDITPVEIIAVKALAALSSVVAVSWVCIKYMNSPRNDRGNIV